MDITKIQEFNKRWGIQDSLSYGEEFRKFKVRVLNIFREVDAAISEEDIAEFCQILGIQEHWKAEIYGYNRWSENVIDALRAETDEKKFYFLLQVIAHFSMREKQEKFSQLRKAIDLSNINLAMTVKNGEIIFHPRGEEKLDEKLVEEVMSFLNPDSQRHFIDALRFYQQGTPQSAVKSAESVRRCVEEFLRFKFGNTVGLEANIKELGTRLKQDGRDPMVRNIIFQTFNFLDTYFNENSKHKDGDINESENEFIVYQAGVLMRYTNKNIR